LGHYTTFIFRIRDRAEYNPLKITTDKLAAYIVRYSPYSMT
jgi:hypothetical protein